MCKAEGAKLTAYSDSWSQARSGLQIRQQLLSESVGMTDPITRPVWPSISFDTECDESGIQHLSKSGH